MNSQKKNPKRRRHANVTASDVAKLAGVSPMTVSRVINDESSVRKSTRKTVKRAIDDLGYSPNMAARSLASADQIRIGLLYSNPSSTYLSKMLLGVLEQTRQSDSQIVVVECDAGPDTDAVIQEMVDDGVDGIILAPPLSDSPQAFRTLKLNNMPTVSVGSPHKADEISSVSIDDYLAAHTITQHLISLGHNRIGFIIGTDFQVSSKLRLEGFRAAMKEAGLEVIDELVIQGEYSYLSGFRSAEQMLCLESPPTAILASNDDMAAGVIAMAHRKSMRVPEDLTVCGFDDSLFATTIWPKITTIHQPVAEMSSLAIKMLEKLVRGQRRHAGKIIKVKHKELDFLLMLRDSDAPPAELEDSNASDNRTSSMARRFGSGSSRKPPA